MTSLYALKPWFQQLLRPVVRRLAALGITANQITLSAIALSMAAGLLVALAPDARWPLVLLPVALLARMALNAIDGMLAREHGQASRLGALLNETGDVASDLFLFVPLMLVTGFSAILVALAIVMAVLTEIAGLAALGIGAQRRYEGPMGKSDRAFAFGALGLCQGWFGLPPLVINGALIAIAGLGFVTVMNRVNAALEQAAANIDQKP